MTTIYPVPAAVTEARVQLAVDQEAKAPPATIANDVGAVAEVQAYVPGFRLKQDVQFEQIPSDAAVRIPGIEHPASGLKVTVFVEVEGAAHYLPAYAGNLDIMTSAALRTGERMAQMLVREMV